MRYLIVLENYDELRYLGPKLKTKDNEVICFNTAESALCFYRKGDVMLVDLWLGMNSPFRITSGELRRMLQKRGVNHDIHFISSVKKKLEVESHTKRFPVDVLWIEDIGQQSLAA